MAPAYAPKTVNTDGWQATQNAWLALFPAITIIQCFLHAFIKIRACSKKRMKALYPAIPQQVWDIYHASTPADFRQQIADFLAWSRQSVSGTALEAIEKLCAKQDVFLLAFDFPNAYRTSNMIDRTWTPWIAGWSAPASFIDTVLLPNYKSAPGPFCTTSGPTVRGPMTTGFIICSYRHPVPVSKLPTESIRTSASSRRIWPSLMS